MKAKEIRISYRSVDIGELGGDLQRLVEEAKHQTDSAYCPYSNFSVGAAVLLDNGVVVGGNNQENIAYPSGLCAERTAMFYANSQYPDHKPTAIAIAAKNDGQFLEKPICPCGGCRQALLEAELRYKSPIRVILYGKSETLVVDSIADMLPFAFVSFD